MSEPTSELTTSAEDLQALTRRVLERHGATTRVAGARLEVDLDEALAAHFGQPTLRLIFDVADAAGDGAGDGVALVAAGSRVFDQLASWLEAGGDVLWASRVGRHAAPDDVPGTLGPAPATRRAVHAQPLMGFDLEVVARAAFITEGRDEQLHVVFAPADGAPQRRDDSALAALVAQGALEPAELMGKRPSSSALTERLGEALALGERVTLDEARRREQALLERLSREVHRLTNYYGELIAHNEQDDALREQLTADLDRRIAEEVATHQLRVELDVLLCAVVLRPQQLYVCELEVDGARAEERWRFDLSDGVWYDAEGVSYTP